QRFHAAGQMLELVHREIGRGAAAEVDELRLAPADERLRGVKGQLRKHCVNVSLDFGRILVGIDLEIAEVAALPAKRNVDVDAEWSSAFRAPRSALSWRALHRGIHFRDKLRFPKRKR